MPVHDVEVERVGAGLEDLAGVVAHAGEIRREDGGEDQRDLAGMCEAVAHRCGEEEGIELRGIQASSETGERYDGKHEEKSWLRHPH